MSNDYTNPNTINPKTLTTFTLTLNDAFESFCASLVCGFVSNYSFESFCASLVCGFVANYSFTLVGAIVTSYSNTYTTS